MAKKRSRTSTSSSKRTYNPVDKAAREIRDMFSSEMQRVNEMMRIRPIEELHNQGSSNQSKVTVKVTPAPKPRPIKTKNLSSSTKAKSSSTKINQVVVTRGNSPLNLMTWQQWDSPTPTNFAPPVERIVGTVTYGSTVKVTAGAKAKKSSSSAKSRKRKK